MNALEWRDQYVQSESVLHRQERASNRQWYRDRGLRTPEHDSEYAMLAPERRLFDRLTEDDIGARPPRRITRPPELSQLRVRWSLPIHHPRARMSLHECLMVKLFELGYWDRIPDRRRGQRPTIRNV